jgi:hypothetical protein
MKTSLSLIAAGALALAGLTTPASAKGCLRGAFIGGVAGHYTVHHGLLGAAAGCAIGHHEAKKREREERLQSRDRYRAYDAK